MSDSNRMPTVHSMKRRSNAHDYSRYGIYHITISVAAALHQPLGRMAGQQEKPDGDPGAPHVELSPVGRMVEKELRESISKYYPMLEVQDYVVMPEHLHFLLVAYGDVVSQNGRPTHLGHVIAGFKLGCNRRYWAMTGGTTEGGGKDKDLATESPGTGNAGMAGTRNAGMAGTGNAGMVGAGNAGMAGTGNVGMAGTEGTGNVGMACAGLVLGDSVTEKVEGEAAGRKAIEAGQAEVRMRRSRGGVPLFEDGYCDVMPVDGDQLATQRAYIRANPRSRLLRMQHRAWLQPQRGTVDTKVTLPALHGFLKRECGSLLLPGVFDALSARLLQKAGMVICDSYGDMSLLKRRLLPVVCHRRDAHLFPMQKASCLREAATGAVLVSARIAKGEQEILDVALCCGYPVVRISDNGFPDRFHPSADRTDDCAVGTLLLLTPWLYQFRGHDEGVSVPFCKAMNCVVQALCRIKDDWWKTS